MRSTEKKNCGTRQADAAIDYEAARQEFERYLDEYDREDEKIRLKIVHTYGVVACAQEIAERKGLDEEDVQLAKLIALLHDIGRFEQIRRFNSFQPDTMDHAAYGAGLLFGKKAYIRRFLKTDVFDEIIREAIARHSDFALGELADGRTFLHARLIRDADKLDNCRVKLEEGVEAMLGVPEEQAGAGLISPKVWEACMRRESVLSAHRKTPVDYWVSYIAQYYDVNFPETFAIIREQKYISRIVERLHYEEPETARKMKELERCMEEYSLTNGIRQ